MGKTTIEWAVFTFNPWIGCTKVSAGCKNCYAEQMMDRRLKKVEWGPGVQRVRTREANWRKPLAWNRKAGELGVRFGVFCASLADVFEEKPDQPEMGTWRADLFDLIDATPHLDWLLLTKRPENIERLWPWGWYGQQYSWSNVWIGTSVENQEQLEIRAPQLERIPARVRFLSIEPLLGPIDLYNYIEYRDLRSEPYFHWVIVGGESGANARPMHPDWARGIRDQCVAAGVPFFFKQWGEWGEVRTLSQETVHRYSKAAHGWDDGNLMFRVGKKAAGRLLDGVEWSEFPEVSDAK